MQFCNYLNSITNLLSDVHKIVFANPERPHKHESANFHVEKLDGDRWNNTIGPSLKMENIMIMLLQGKMGAKC